MRCPHCNKETEETGFLNPQEFGKEEHPDCFYQVWGHGSLDIIHENESIMIGSPDGSRFKELKKAMEIAEKTANGK